MIRWILREKERLEAELKIINKMIENTKDEHELIKLKIDKAFMEGQIAELTKIAMMYSTLKAQLIEMLNKQTEGMDPQRISLITSTFATVLAALEEFDVKNTMVP